MKKLLTVTCLAGLLSIPSVVFADEAVPEEVMSDEAMAEEAMPEEPEISPEMQGHLGDSHSGAAWYGTIRAGVKSTSGTEGTGSFWSRWGIRGSSEVSEGLTAVYRFETRINATNANQQEPNGRLSYVGLSGGFGSITAGQISSATTNSFGSITDNSVWFGDSETSGRHGHVVSYAVSVGSVDLQADVVMNNGDGNSATVCSDYDAVTGLCEAFTSAAASVDDIAKGHSADNGLSALLGKEDKLADAYEFGVTVNDIMETGRIALAHKTYDEAKFESKNSTYLAGEYSIGGMTVYLGAAQHKSKDDRACMTFTAAEKGKAATVTTVGDSKTPVKYKLTPATIKTAGKFEKTENCVGAKQTDKTTFAGVRGSVGDTGISYLFQARSKKTKGNAADIDGKSASLGSSKADNVLGFTYADPGDGKNLTSLDTVDPNGASLAANKHTPWLFGLYKSLGGGASIGFEYSDPDGGADGTDTKSTSGIWLLVDF